MGESAKIIAWQPQEGPQDLFVRCPAFEAFYGGAVGGGKTDALLGDFARGIELGSAWVGVYFRKHFPDMDDVIRRSFEIFGPVYGKDCYSASKYQWNFPSGAILQFRALERDDDVYKYQGQQYCVAKGTRIRMSDGSLKSIENIVAGEMVDTLDGPHRVLVTHDIGTKPCVRAVFRDYSGSIIGEQEHPEDHPILNASGTWDSYASLAGGPSGCEASDGCNRGAQQPQALCVPVVLRAPYPRQDADDQASSIQCRALGKLKSPSEATCQDLSGERPARSLPLERTQSHQGRTASPSAADGGACALPGRGTGEDSRCGCPPGRRSRDGQLPLQSGSGRGLAPSAAGEETPSRSGCTPGDPGNAPECTPTSGFAYAHPYTGEELIASAGVTYGSCKMTPCGEREVFDLTIDKVAHYITEVNSVSRNCWIGFDELTQWASPFPYTYMMTRLRSAKGAPVRMRAASNPANVGHAWVKARFIDPMPAGIPLLVETKSGKKYHRVFIKSQLEDNKILMRNDPGYSDRIYEVDPSLAKALREGNWNIVAGAAFPEFSEQHHVIDNYPIPTDRPCWRSLDWGYDTPYGNLWMFPSNDAELILGGELYGWSGKPNVGTKESPAEVRHKIAMFEALHEIYVPYGMLDNQCWEERGLPSQIVKELSGNQYDEYRLNWQPWKKGPNSRVQQKQLIHGLMAVTNGKSRLKIMRRCHHTIRTLPIIQQDPRNIEDVETTGEDHLYDALRGGATKNVPTKDEVRRKFLARQYAAMEFGDASQLEGGAF
jgi:hypothetical protein